MTNYKELFIATTDTVVGIGAQVSNETRVKINCLKGSPRDKRLVILVASIAMAEKFFKTQGFDETAKVLALKYWPGAYTLVCNQTLALRMPDRPKLLALIAKLGPIYMTSANFTGQNPLDFSKACQTFPNLGNYYDFGPGSNQPSVIIDVKTKEILRK